MKIAVQTGGIIDQLGAEKCYKTIAEAGFEAIDWNIDHALRAATITNGEYRGNCIFEKELDEILDYYKEELFYIKKNNLTITQAHAPFPAYVTGKPEVLEYMIGIYKKVILFLDAVGCQNVIIHGVSGMKKHDDELIESIDALNDKLYSSLIPELQRTNVTVCIENLPAGGGADVVAGVCGDPREAVEMIDLYNQAAGKECFGLCLDTGHMNIMRHEPRRYISVIGKRIKALHIHDNAGNIDQHKAPYTGTIDWNAFCSALKSIGYEGDLSFETFNQVSLNYIDEELLMPWLELICTVGKHFRKKILE